MNPHSTMTDMYRMAYKPYFAWDESQSHCADGGGSMKDATSMPPLLLSDSEDEMSVPEEGRTSSPLHEEVSWGDVHQVRFSAARIREHSVILGDHPTCCDCLPLSLDWEHGDEKVFDINVYEDMRVKSGRQERGKVEKLDYWEKHDILEKSGIRSHPEWDAPSEPSMEVEYPESEPEPVSQCNPLAFLEGTGWGGFFGDGTCFSYPAMKVEVLE